MISTFSKKKIRITITKPNATDVVFENYAVDCVITKSGGETYCKADVDIYGLPRSKMVEFTFTFASFKKARYVLTIEAGEDGKELAVAYKGEVWFSYYDLNGGSPVLHIESQMGCYPANTKQEPLSKPNESDVGSVMDELANLAGYVTEWWCSEAIKIKDWILNGDIITMAKYLGNAVGLDVLFDDMKLVGFPKGKYRGKKENAPVINAQNGMMGYPIMTMDGVQIVSYFRPDVLLGGLVKVEVGNESVDTANGYWFVTQITHTLSANNPDNQAWSTSISCSYIDTSEKSNG